MTGTTTISITEKRVDQQAALGASAIGPLGLRMTARSHAPAESRAAPTTIAQRCDLANSLLPRPRPYPFIENAGLE